MKFQMAKNSMFAVLLRSPWWISIGIAVAVGLVAAALLPAQFKGAGALSGLPFAVIGVLAAGGVGLRVLTLRGANTVEGGVPIVIDGKIVGAIGVSGGTSEQDGVVAKAALDAMAAK